VGRSEHEAQPVRIQTRYAYLMDDMSVRVSLERAWVSEFCFSSDGHACPIQMNEAMQFVPAGVFGVDGESTIEVILSQGLG